MDSALKIEQAFLQLSFAIKLHFYIEDKLIDKAVFDREIRFTSLKTTFPANEFNQYEDIQRAASNAVMISLGFSAMMLSESLDSKRSELSEVEKEFQNLVYMIRCCFAHNAIKPRWVIKPKYQRCFDLKLGITEIYINLKEKNNTIFTIEDIGGYDGYFKMRDVTLGILKNTPK